MESAAKIRRLVLRDGRSIRSVSRDTGLSRNTIKKYLNDATPPRYRRSQPPVRHKLQGFEDRLGSLFEQDQKRVRRERRTAVKLYEQLVEEGYTGSYSPVCRFVKALKADGSKLLHAYIPLHFKAGDAVQFDWSEEHVVLGGVEQKIKVAHFRLCHSRKPFIVAYPGESQEMVLDAFVRALAFYGGVPRRVIIDNPKTMVTYVSRSKDRIYHPRFLALMNHYVMEPVACTPASGWEKGQIENQVQHIRQWLFTPKLDFSDLEALNAWLSLRCNELGSRSHPDQKDQTIDAVFAKEQAELRPLGVGFDGYVEKVVRVRSTCLVQYHSNRYSVPAQYAGRHISLRAYAGRIVLVADQKIIAEHKRRFPHHKDFATFDYGISAVKKPEVEQLCTGQFTTDAHNLILVGGTGTGKTHIAIALGAALINQGKKARYYQAEAINRTIEKVSKGENRVLLVMATGTGKTYTTFQIVWRLWKARAAKRILFLADRNILIDQTLVNDFKPFGAVMTKTKNRRIDPAYEIHLGLYQALTGPEEKEKAFKSVSRDFFDLIVIDECHRGSSADDAAWKEILEYFSAAIQIGLRNWTVVMRCLTGFCNI